MARIKREESFVENVDNTLRRSAAANLNMIGAEIQLTAAASGVVPDDTFTVTQVGDHGDHQLTMNINKSEQGDEACS